MCFKILLYFPDKKETKNLIMMSEKLPVFLPTHIHTHTRARICGGFWYYYAVCLTIKIYQTTHTYIHTYAYRCVCFSLDENFRNLLTISPWMTKIKVEMHVQCTLLYIQTSTYMYVCMYRWNAPEQESEMNRGKKNPIHLLWGTIMNVKATCHVKTVCAHGVHHKYRIHKPKT